MKKVSLILVAALCLVFACGTSVAYTYYGLDVSRMSTDEMQKGKLLAKDPKDDLDLTECSPSKVKKAPCITMFSTEYFKAMRDLEALRAQLKACQAR